MTTQISFMRNKVQNNSSKKKKKKKKKHNSNATEIGFQEILS